MHIGLRSFLATAALGLALAPSAFADTATETLVLARDDCGGTDNLRLDWAPGASTTGCGNLAAGLGAVAGSTPEEYPSVTSAGPFTLQSGRNIVIDVSVDSFTGGPVGGIGNETISFDLVGRTTAGKNVALASASKTTAAQDEIRNGHYVTEFQIPVPDAKAGDYKSVTLSLSVGGAELGGFVNPDGSSFVDLPIPGDVDATAPDQG